MSPYRGGHGEYVWVNANSSTNEFSVPFGARVIRTEKSEILVSDDDGKQFWVASGDVEKTMHVTAQKGVDDMMTLGDLQEYAILRNLEIRYKRQQIYTYTGPMLIAINPYEVLTIYTNREIALYRNRKINELPPHIFAISDNAFQKMKSDLSNQCIVISGESGAGKTESTKLILQYLAAISGKHSWIEQQIIEANPILEAFGNAKTLRNDNSSRFGKYIDIRFTEGGSIQGARIDQYLLENSRIVSQNREERNYHIFYCLLAGLSKEERIHLDLVEDSALQYYYLAQGGCATVPGKSDAKDFADIRSAMQVLSFQPDEMWSIFKLLAAILHLGNLEFKATIVRNMDASEVNNAANLTTLAALLGISKEVLCAALTRKTIYVHGERVETSNSKEAALEGRDAFVKALYSSIFVRVVKGINDTIGRINDSRMNSIGVLDIFGFENFESNSFEQLCINYANENLQQFFVEHIFKMEEAEYQDQGINWQNIKYVDNQNILDMIGMKSVNIMSLIDEESKFPKGNDMTLLEKLHVQHGTRSIYVKPKSPQTTLFGIQHYAGVVMYNPCGFLEKNRDSFSLDLREMIAKSTNKYLVEIFLAEQPNDTMKKQLTLSVKFRNSLDLLMRTLSAAHPFFIRCIKPNNLKKPKQFDRELCVRQLRYSGMMETARIRHDGYPIRYSYAEFVERYRLLLTGISRELLFNGNCRTISEFICKQMLPPETDYQFGRLKVFLKDADYVHLESERSRIVLRSILTIQRSFRKVLFRRHLKKYRQAVLTIQRTWRGHKLRRDFLIARAGFHRLGACIAARQLALRFTVLRRRITHLQAHCRGWLARKQYRASFGTNSRQVDDSNLKATSETNYQQYLGDFGTGGINANVDNSNDENNYIDDESSKQIVDDVFGFLDETDPLRKVASTGGTIRIPTDHRPHQDLSDYSFAKFAAIYFNSSVSNQYSKRPLKESLLSSDLPADNLAAKAIWIMVLRFMGDMAEAKYDGDRQEETKTSVMQGLAATLSKSTVQRREFKEALSAMGESSHQRLIRKTLRRKNKLPAALRKALDNSDAMEYYERVLNTRSSNLEKLHFIIGHGILRPDLRDEILAQICKQLTNNPYRTSFAKGWILLSLCIGCFPPGQRFENYLRLFIRCGPQLYASYCELRLDRTLKNGARTQPPSWLELQATRNKAPIVLNVFLTDGNAKKLQVDSASTAQEAVQQLAAHIGLIDHFGFSIVVALFDKVLSLGSGREHVMDSISNCEQYAKENGQNERKAPWKMYLRKEMFTTWYDPAKDHLATHLIYKQIVHGLNYGEYRCRSEKDIAMICALEYFAENGAQLDSKILRRVLPDYVPKYLLAAAEGAMSSWESMIKEAFLDNDYVKKDADQQCAKEDICLYAQITWPMLFSRFFEAVRRAGPRLISDNIVIAVNSAGVFFVDETEVVLLELSYPEIAKAYASSDIHSTISELYIDSVQREGFVFMCYEAHDVADLLSFMLKNLRLRSKYGIATQDYKSPTDEPSGRLLLHKGDLVQFDVGVTGVNVEDMNTLWARGICNGNIGDFPTEAVTVLPTLTKPSPKIVQAFKESNVAGKCAQHNASQCEYKSVQPIRMHTLKKFADQYFRTNMGGNRSTKLPEMHSINSRVEDLWRHSFNTLKAPLLKKLQQDQESFEKAVLMFNQIMKYMGDTPRGKFDGNTDSIFAPALSNENLCDELYCQLMKQLTENRLQQSKKRGWDLLWLASGILLPSSMVRLQLTEFLRTRKNVLAAECLKRLKRALASGQRRKHAPYIIEVEAIQHRCMQIYQKIHFPDRSVEAFEIESFTRATDLMKNISKRLGLKSIEGFSLFVNVGKEAYSIPEHEYVFDFFTEILAWLKQSTPTRTTTEVQLKCQHQLYFMKKLWLHVQPGKDRNADVIFYYPQELSKYLKGYYKGDKESAPKMAALICLADYGKSVLSLQRVHDILPRLVPADIKPLMASHDWKTHITIQIHQLIGQHVDEVLAKQTFLIHISAQQTFGSTFFLVKQLNDSSLPENILLAINRHGLLIIDPSNKDVLQSYDYTELNFWSSGNTFFQIRFGNMIGASKLLCSTSQGYKIDDLLSSYTKHFNKNL